MESKNKTFRLAIISHTKQSDHVDYKIRLMSMDEGNLIIEFSERYSTLLSLDENLRKETASPSFPRFPPKKFLGSTEEKFLNQRQTELNNYFDKIFTSREFSQLPSLKKWIENSLKKYSKDSVKAFPQEANVIKNIKPIEQANDLSKKGAYKEIIDNCINQFIDCNVATDFDDDTETEFAKAYKQTIETMKPFNGDISLALQQEDDKHIESIDNTKEDESISSFEKMLLGKLNDIHKAIGVDMKNDYQVSDIIVPI